MNEIAAIVIPVFGLIGLGFIAAWTGLLKEATGEAVAEFVFTVAIPMLIFRVVATADFSGGTPWRLWIDYYIGFSIAWIVGTQVMRRVFRRDARAGLVAGVSSAYPNALLIGLPLVIAAYGATGAAAVSLLIAINLPVMMTISAILIERALVTDGLAPDADFGSTARGIARALIKNPIVIGVFAGTAWRIAGLPIAGPAGDVVARLGDIASTLALFTVGMNLRHYGISGNIRTALAVCVIKLVVMPALVFAAVAFLFHLPQTWGRAIVIASACPTGVNAYLVATRFNTGQALASNSITLSTALAVFTVAFWLQAVTWL
ncbi:MAG TPA: AEC family transporter [Bauldia sp.]|nr:AEC family transporter [Bauldia sp.]